MLVRGKPLTGRGAAPELWAHGEPEGLADWLMDHAPAMVAYVDSDLHYVRVNARYRELFGCPVEGRPVAEVMGRQYERVRHELQAALKGEKRNFELPMTLRGEERMLEATYIPDFDGDGLVRGLMVYAFDVTERWRTQRALEQSEERLRLALSATNGVGIWNWDIEGDVVVADKGFAQLFELPAEVAAEVRHLVDELHRVLLVQGGVGGVGFGHRLHQRRGHALRIARHRRARARRVGDDAGGDGGDVRLARHLAGELRLRQRLHRPVRLHARRKVVRDEEVRPSLLAHGSKELVHVRSRLFLVHRIAFR